MKGLKSLRGQQSHQQVKTSLQFLNRDSRLYRRVAADPLCLLGDVKWLDVQLRIPKSQFQSVAPSAPAESSPELHSPLWPGWPCSPWPRCTAPVAGAGGPKDFSMTGICSKRGVAVQLLHQASCGWQRKQRTSLTGQISCFREVFFSTYSGGAQIGGSDICTIIIWKEDRRILLSLSL